MTPPRSVADRLRAYRLTAGLTLDQLAERSGVSTRTLSDIERGVSVSPQARTLSAIADGLDLDPSARERFVRTRRSRPSSQFGSHRASAVAPHRVSDFTGREKERIELHSLLARSDADRSARVVVVSGPAGIGKTTSALEALSEATSATLHAVFADLDGLSPAPLTPLQVLRALLRQLPMVGDAVPADLSEATELWRSATKLQPVSVLLDNASHESQVRPVIAIGAENLVVITSRRSLAGLESARRIRLGPLNDEDSIALLGRLISTDQQQAGDLRELAQLCDHVPLALRIVGNRIASRPTWQASDFLVRLRKTENRLRLLVAGDLAVESAFALSYEELEPETAALFRSISVIEGSTFDARLAAATEGADVLMTEERLDELIDLGLVEARGGNRFRLHDLLRLYASQCLLRESGSPGVVATQTRLRHWLLRSLERAGAWFEPNRSPESLDEGGMSFPSAEVSEAWIRLEEPHWWTAMQAAALSDEFAIVVDVADSLHWFSEVWLEWGHWTKFFSLAVDASRSLGDARLEAMHLGYVVWSILLENTDRVGARETAALGVIAADLSGDSFQQGWANFYVAMVANAMSDFDTAIAACRLSVAAFAIAGDADGANQAMITMSRALRSQGRPDLAVAELEQIVARSIETKSTTHPLVQMITELNAREIMNDALLDLGRHAYAIESATQALLIAAQFDSPARTATSLRHRAQANIAAGDLARAREDLGRAVGLFDANSDDAYLHRESAAIESLLASLPPE